MADSISVEKWLDFWKYYEGTPNQELGVRQLFEGVPSSLKLEDSSWITKYREPEPKPELPEVSNPIPVEYDCQLNHGDEGWRLCFTASCAMACHYADPSISIADYYARRPQYGDSTDPSAQIRTIKSFGLDCRYGQMGSIEKLKEELATGRPAPVAFLHHGSSSAPSGGGHWILAVGTYEENGGGLIAHDPYGELDCLGGGYPKTGGTYGKFIKYSWKNWAPRWSVSGDHDGWGMGIMLPGKL